MPPYKIDRHQPAFHESSQLNSPCHILSVASQLTDEQSLSTWRAVHRPPLSTRPISLDYGLQVHLQTRTITDSKCKSPNSHDRGLKVHLQTRTITASKCISEFPCSRPPSASLSSLHLGLQVHLQTRSITASKCISEFTRSSSSGAPRIADYHRVLPVQIYRV